MLRIPLAFFDGSLGSGEVILIFVVILVLFGPRRLPQIARMIGKTLNELRRASQDFRDQVMRIEESPPLDVPSGNSIETSADNTERQDGLDKSPELSSEGATKEETSIIPNEANAERQDRKEINDLAG